MGKKIFSSGQPFLLESGGVLPQVEIAYHTYGFPNKERNNTVWVCHALTADSDCTEWWNGLFGKGKLFDPGSHFIVCANILSSCYGSSGPLSVNPLTGKKYYSTFPQVTIRDMVNAHILLRKQLEIEKIFMGIGGSMGGYQVLEWACAERNIFDRMVLLTTGARESAWGIAIHTAQRLAIEADPTWKDDSDKAGAQGLKAARAIGMLTYRSYEQFVKTQTDDAHAKLDNYKAASYIHYQGDKLVNRFNAYSYWLLTKAMDSHNLARGRESMEKALASVKTKSLVIGIQNDFLCPLAEQRFLAKHLGSAALAEIASPYGHDGFLVETDRIAAIIRKFLNN